MEKAEKEGLSDPSLTLGVASRDDINMEVWNGTIIGPPATTFDSRFYSIQIICGKDYPNSSPSVRFQTGTFSSFFFPIFLICILKSIKMKKE